MKASLLCTIIASFMACASCYPKQFTFELPDNQKMCFYETIKEPKNFVIYYRVVRGGHNDVDVKVISPSKQEIYNKQKSHYDQYTFKALAGVYTFCFGNEFSSITHKQVFFEIRPETFENLDEEAGRPHHKPSAETLIESAMDTIHASLSQVEEIQTEYRVREGEGRGISEEVNQRVLFWSILVAIAIVITGFGQVTVLKNFFTDKSATYSTMNARI